MALPLLLVILIAFTPMLPPDPGQPSNSSRHHLQEALQRCARHPISPSLPRPEVPQIVIKQEEVPTRLEDIGEPGYFIQMRQRVKTSTPPGARSLREDADEEATPRERHSREARDTDTAPTTPTCLRTVIKPTGKSTSISHRAQARRAQLMPPPNPEREGDAMAAAPKTTSLHSMELRNTTPQVQEERAPAATIRGEQEDPSSAPTSSKPPAHPGGSIAHAGGSQPMHYAPAPRTLREDMLLYPYHAAPFAPTHYGAAGLDPHNLNMYYHPSPYQNLAAPLHSRAPSSVSRADLAGPSAEPLAPPSKVASTSSALAPPGPSDMPGWTVLQVADPQPLLPQQQALPCRPLTPPPSDSQPSKRALEPTPKATSTQEDPSTDVPSAQQAGTADNAAASAAGSPMDESGDNVVHDTSHDGSPEWDEVPGMSYEEAAEAEEQALQEQADDDVFGTPGRLSDDMRQILRTGFAKMNTIVEQVSKDSGLPAARVQAMFGQQHARVNTARNHWNIYGRYFKMNQAQECKRLGLDAPLADTIEIRSKTYTLFKEVHADIWRDILETFKEVEVWAANHTVGQCKRDFAKAVAKMRQLCDNLALRYDFSTAFLMAGNLVNTDTGLAQLYETAMAKNFLSTYLRGNEDTSLAHFKSYLYHQTSMGILNEASENGDEDVGGPSKPSGPAIAASCQQGGAPSKQHAGPSEQAAGPSKASTQVPGPSKQAGTSSNEGTIKSQKDLDRRKFGLEFLHPDWRKKLSSTDKAGVIRFNVREMEVAAGGPWERKYNNLFPWNHHAELLVTQGLVWKNYPDDVRWPGEEKTGGRNKAKGIAELSMPELDRMIEGLVDRDYPFEFERVDKEALKKNKLPVIICAPPAHDATFKRARRYFANGTSDRKGPPRCEAPASSGEHGESSSPDTDELSKDTASAALSPVQAPPPKASLTRSRVVEVVIRKSRMSQPTTASKSIDVDDSEDDDAPVKPRADKRKAINVEDSEDSEDEDAYQPSEGTPTPVKPRGAKRKALCNGSDTEDEPEDGTKKEPSKGKGPSKGKAPARSTKRSKASAGGSDVEQQSTPRMPEKPRAQTAKCPAPRLVHAGARTRGGAMDTTTNEQCDASTEAPAQRQRPARHLHEDESSPEHAPPKRRHRPATTEGAPTEGTHDQEHHQEAPAQRDKDAPAELHRPQEGRSKRAHAPAPSSGTAALPPSLLHQWLAVYDDEDGNSTSTAGASGMLGHWMFPPPAPFAHAHDAPPGYAPPGYAPPGYAPRPRPTLPHAPRYAPCGWPVDSQTLDSYEVMDPRDAGHYYCPLPPQFRAPEFRAPGLMTPDGTYIPSGRVHPHFYEDFGQAAAFTDVPQGMPYAGFEAAAPPARRMPGTAGAQTAGVQSHDEGEQ
ncbi:hypothetical protein POSPLADRAFT_1058570 [Postia placenta MAD-698-R-SB12]|uniref:Uncharacterized protein n=1 Tax=Postia placenta MAD-698-R-SB12 TaxID=670580 RepID=A0A1X6MVP2_9APHY|nr:hypothetical protein POSPLADRAFT_1058570 [Postia placenta MAD-698-R-SB12]OSX60409.1 hypothetical protein POSPLADRAFT_1058570 [Postia placenta MAD-698-R-SB12]